MSTWHLTEDGYRPTQAGYYETIFTLANGYIGLRGTLAFQDEPYRPGLFVSGLYDRNDAQVTELVNLPSPLHTELSVEGERLSMEESAVESHVRRLDMARGVLDRETVLSTDAGHRIGIATRRFVSLHDPHLIGFELTITNETRPPRGTARGGPASPAEVRITAGIDPTVRNYDKGEGGYHTHLQGHEWRELDPGVSLCARTIDDDIEVALATRMGVDHADRACEYRTVRKEDRLAEEMATTLAPGEHVTVTRWTTVWCEAKRRANRHAASPAGDRSPSVAGDHPAGADGAGRVREAAARHLREVAPGELDRYLGAHRGVWQKRWSISDIVVDGDDELQRALRYVVFSLTMLGEHLDGETSVGAKGMHGEGYRGHVFWDSEIYLLPFYIHTNPDAARRLLLYRYHRLESARSNAGQYGCGGAKFPWESAGSGEEVAPRIMYLPNGEPVRCWTGDEALHISSDVAFGFHAYSVNTGDEEFLLNHAAEVIVEVARYWDCRLEYNEAADRFEITSVMGPDEFHYHVHNSYYTNFLARWVLETAASLLQRLKERSPDRHRELVRRLGLAEEEEEVSRFREKAGRLYLPDADEVIEEFDGFFELTDYVIDEYDELGMPRLPDHLQFEPDFFDYRLLKQADVVLLMHLFPEAFTPEQKRASYDYYQPRTTHMSSLSPSMYSLMGIEVGNTDLALRYLRMAATMDLSDRQSNTSEGIHVACMGGTWQAAVTGLGGFRPQSEDVQLRPWLPEPLSRLEYSVLWRGLLLRVTVTPVETHVRAESAGAAGSISLVIDGEARTIGPGDSLVVTRDSRVAPRTVALHRRRMGGQ